MSKNRSVRLAVLPGEPKDGTGKVCIHLFVVDEDGPFTEPHVIHQDKPGKLYTKPTKGKIACSNTRTVTPVVYNGVTSVTMRTDDPRAVTCLKCKETAVYKEKLARLGQ